MLENRPSLKLKKNNATSFSGIFQSEQNWASYDVFVKTDDTRTMLGCRTPFSFCLYTTYLSSMPSREQGPQTSVCTPVQHTLWLDQLYYFILSLVVVFAVYNATKTTTMLTNIKQYNWSNQSVCCTGVHSDDWGPCSLLCILDKNVVYGSRHVLFVWIFFY